MLSAILTVIFISIGGVLNVPIIRDQFDNIPRVRGWIRWLALTAAVVSGGKNISDARAKEVAAEVAEGRARAQELENAGLRSRVAGLEDSGRRNRPRTLVGTNVSSEFMTRMSRTTSPISVTALGYDAETVTFAQSILWALQQIGHETTTGTPNTGNTLPENVGVFRIESVQTGEGDPLRAFAEWLASVGYPATFSAGKPKNAISIGPRLQGGPGP